MEKKLDLSIIIPVYNGEKTLNSCLKSIFACKKTNYEVILIDDGSTDNTLKIAEKYPCKIINFEKNKGRSAARNEGIKQSKAKYVLFTDADCIVEKDWQEKALKSIMELQKKDKNIAAVEGKILSGKGFFNKCDTYSGYGYNQNNKKRYHRHFCTANLIADKSKLIEAGLFDEKLITHEDQDLGFRLLEKGYKLYYDPSFSIIHNTSRETLKDFINHHYKWGKTLGNYFEKRYSKLRKNPLGKSESIILNIILAPLISLLITIKITLHNFLSTPSVLLYSPFIFISKMAYRIGTIEYIMKEKNKEKANG